MKQIWTFLFLVILIFGCQSKEVTVGEENVYTRKEWFSVSENDRRLDSIQNTIPKDGYEKVRITYVGNEDTIQFYIGKFHFLILNEKNAFVISRTEIYLDFLICCANDTSNFEQERIRFAKNLDRVEPIKLSEIKEYLEKNKDEIIAGKEFRQTPLNITFALKNDTLKGSFMNDITNFMENNGMNVYRIRRMNDRELEAVENYHNKK